MNNSVRTRDLLCPYIVKTICHEEKIGGDPRYQDFIKRAVLKKVMGYALRVAALEDVLQGKVWAYADKPRRKSKRQKDLADIFRLVETYPRLKGSLPEEIREGL